METQWTVVKEEMVKQKYSEIALQDKRNEPKFSMLVIRVKRPNWGL